MTFGNILHKLFVEIDKRQERLDFSCDVVIRKSPENRFLDMVFEYSVGNRSVTFSRSISIHELEMSRIPMEHYLDLFFEGVKRQRQDID